MSTFSHWTATPEGRSAFEAVRGVAASVGRKRSAAPLLLHGPSGSGKTHLVTALAADLVTRHPGLSVVHLPARSLAESPLDMTAARACDLLIAEDVQHLAVGIAAAFGRLLDFRAARRRPVVITSVHGPGRLTHLPLRLTSRLSAGLVVGLEPYGPASRRLLLEAMATRRRLKLSAEVLNWLAAHVGGSGRQLDGALTRVEAMTRLTGRPPGVEAVAVEFGAESEASRLTAERIAESVGRELGVRPRDMRSTKRGQAVLRARQVAMHLARLLTPLTLVQVGAFFGGRDHSTVLNACRRVERMLTEDMALAAAVRRLTAELTPARRAG